MPRLALLLSLLLPLAACDSSGLDDDGVAVWAGSYTGQSRFGATTGTWGNGGTYPVVVSASGQVTISGDLIVGTYDAATSAFAWSREAGNATNGEITFHETATSSFFFADLTNETAGQGFTGFIRRGSDGPLDYRGVLR